MLEYFASPEFPASIICSIIASILFWLVKESYSEQPLGLIGDFKVRNNSRQFFERLDRWADEPLYMYNRTLKFSAKAIFYGIMNILGIAQFIVCGFLAYGAVLINFSQRPLVAIIGFAYFFTAGIFYYRYCQFHKPPMSYNWAIVVMCIVLMCTTIVRCCS